MPLNGKKLSQTNEVTQASTDHYVPIFIVNTSNERIKLVVLIDIIKGKVTDELDVYTKTEIDDFLNEKANDDDVLHKDGDETKSSGVLTFGEYPELPDEDPTGDLQPIPKKFFDTAIEAINEALSNIDTELSDKADDADVLHKTGDETKDDVLTFTSFIVLPSTAPSADNQATNKKYVDDADSVLSDLITTLSNALATKANDSDVLHNTGDENKSGILTFNDSPIIPDATQTNQPASYGQLQDVEDEIDDFETELLDRWVGTADIDCSANPNYPASTRNDTLLVSVDGKIGGANGKSVEKGDLIYCKTTSAGGSEATAGNDFAIFSRKIYHASDTEFGTIKKSDNTTALSGVDTESAIVPATLKYVIDQLLLKRSNVKTLRFYIGIATPPNGYTGKPASAVVQDNEMKQATIYGMMFLDNSPFDYKKDGIGFNEVTGELDFSALAPSGLVEGQTILMTVFK